MTSEDPEVTSADPEVVGTTPDVGVVAPEVTSPLWAWSRPQTSQVGAGPRLRKVQRGQGQSWAGPGRGFGLLARRGRSHTRHSTEGEGLMKVQLLQLQPCPESPAGRTSLGTGSASNGHLSPPSKISVKKWGLGCWLASRRSSSARSTSTSAVTAATEGGWGPEGGEGKLSPSPDSSV